MVDEFQLILRNFCNKIDRNLEIHESSIYDYLWENIELSESVLNGKVVMETLKKAFLNLTLNYKYFISLIIKNFG